jgi:hypothetical protein
MSGRDAPALHAVPLRLCGHARTCTPVVERAQRSSSSRGPALPQIVIHQATGRAAGSFWQKRYYDRNLRDHREFVLKIGYIHRNPVKRGLVRSPEEWKWSSYRHYALREMGVVEIESKWTARDRERDLTGGPERIFLTQGMNPG